MKLIDLEPEFVQHKLIDAWHPGDPPRWMAVHVDTLAEAHGIMFLCPKCYADEPVGPVGTHRVLCWFVGKVADDVTPGPGRWTPKGTGVNDLSFVPSPGRTHSILLTGGCNWHGFIINGDAT